MLVRMNHQWDAAPQPLNPKDRVAFDLIRATVNLTVASLLIAWATGKQLPLSTTYVTFMVAMGSSLADKAWGRESAVYRVTGVLTVISGWFMTGLAAFTLAAVMANRLALRAGVRHLRAAGPGGRHPGEIHHHAPQAGEQAFRRAF